MSAFGNTEKDEIVDCIKYYIINKKEEDPNECISHIIEDVMEAVTVGVTDGLSSVEDE